MDKLLKILNIVKTYFLVAVILVLLVVLFFKNNKITKLTTQLAEKPKVEYIYNTKTDTITIEAKPYQVIKWKETKDTIYIPLDLSSADSSQIAQAYKKLFEEFGEEKVYKDVVKDDSTAYIELIELVQYNKLQERTLMFTDRTPVVNVTNTVISNKQFISITGGVSTSFNGTFTSVSINGGLVTKKNMVMRFGYDPFNNIKTIGVDFPIFNFNK